MRNPYRKIASWRRRWADKLQRIAERQEAAEREIWNWTDPLTLEWRAKLAAGERGESKN